MTRFQNFINWSLWDRYSHSRKYDLAIKQFQKTITLKPDNIPATISLGYSYLYNKQTREAINMFTYLPSTLPGRGLILSNAYALSGDKAKAKTELEKILREVNNPDHWWLALAYIGVGNFNEALSQLEKCYEMGLINLVVLKISPFFDPIRNEPRFKALLKKMGFRES